MVSISSPNLWNISFRFVLLCSDRSIKTQHKCSYNHMLHTIYLHINYLGFLRKETVNLHFTFKYQRRRVFISLWLLKLPLLSFVHQIIRMTSNMLIMWFNFVVRCSYTIVKWKMVKNVGSKFKYLWKNWSAENAGTF